MNYLDLVNKCLTELNYKNITSIDGLVKNEHKKIQNIINVLNSEICMSENWYFVTQKCEFLLKQSQSAFLNPIDGKIISLIIDGKSYKYTPNYECFLGEGQNSDTFSILNDTILLPPFGEDKRVEIIYHSKNCVKSLQGEEKQVFSDENDESVIPEPFVEPLLVYGTCMRLKGNPSHIRFSFWLGMFNNALANLRKHCKLTEAENPVIKMFRV